MFTMPVKGNSTPSGSGSQNWTSLHCSNSVGSDNEPKLKKGSYSVFEIYHAIPFPAFSQGNNNAWKHFFQQDVP